MATAKTWIVLTDTEGSPVRINVPQIIYYRAVSSGGSVLGFGGSGKDRLVMQVKEGCEEIDQKIGGDFVVPTYGMMNI